MKTIAQSFLVFMIAAALGNFSLQLVRKVSAHALGLTYAYHDGMWHLGFMHRESMEDINAIIQKNRMAFDNKQPYPQQEKVEAYRAWHLQRLAYTDIMALVFMFGVSLLGVIWLGSNRKQGKPVSLPALAMAVFLIKPAADWLLYLMMGLVPCQSVALYRWLHIPWPVGVTYMGILCSVCVLYVVLRFTGKNNWLSIVPAALAGALGGIVIYGVFLLKILVNAS